MKSQQQEMQLVLFSHLQIHYDMFPGSIGTIKCFRLFLKDVFLHWRGSTGRNSRVKCPLRDLNLALGRQ